MSGTLFNAPNSGLPDVRKRTGAEQRIVPNLLHHLPDILSQLNDAVMVVANGGEIVYWNPAAERLHGIPAADLVGKKWRSVKLYKMGTEAAASLIFEVLMRERVWRRETTYVRPDGAVLNIEITASILRNEQRKRAGIVAVVRDITDRKRLEISADRTARLMALTSALSKARTLNDVCEVVVEHSVAAAGARAATIARMMPDGSSHLLATVGHSDRQLERFREVSRRPAPGRRALLQTMSPIWAESIDKFMEEYPEFRPPELLQEYRGFALLPLTVNDRQLGVIGLSFHESRPFPEDERSFLQSFAEQCGQAIDRALAYEFEREHRRIAELGRERTARLQTVITGLAAAETPMEVARIILTAGAEAVNAPKGAVCLLTADGRFFETVDSVGGGSKVTKEWLRFPADLPIPYGDAVKYQTPVFIETAAEYNERYPLIAERLDDEGYCATASLPLLNGGRVLGMMSFDYTESRAFDPDERSELIVLAGQCAQALERTRLYQLERQARADAERERDRLQQVLDVLPEGVAIADADGYWQMANPAAKELMGTLFTGGRIPEGTGTERTPADIALRDGTIIRGVQIFLENRLTKRQVPLLVNAAPLRDANGMINGVVSAFQDISMIRDFELAREEFFSSISHDLKTPLTAILGAAQLARRQIERIAVPESDGINQRLSSIDVSVNRILGLINELLDVTRIRSGRPLQIQRKQADIVSLARTVLRDLQTTTGRHTIVFSADVEELTVDVDARRIERVIVNLISNAIKYTPHHGEILVSLSHDEHQITICIQDPGIGIPADELELIFERYYRGRNVSGNVIGTGIGLATVREIVEQHGGSVTMTSTEGEGSTFTICLPRSAPA